MKSVTTLLCIGSISLFAGCFWGVDLDDDLDDDDDDDWDEALLITSNWENWSNGAAFPVIAPFAEAGFDGGVIALGLTNAAPQDVAALNADLYYAPAGCASLELDGNRLTYALSGCSGGLDASRLDGTVRVTLADGGDRIDFELVSQDLAIEGVDANLSANGTYSAAGDTRTLEYTAQRALAGNAAFAGEFSSTLTWTAGSNCVTHETTGQVMRAGRELDVDVRGYVRCGSRCPIAGVVTLSDNGNRASLTFDGSDRARLERSAGAAESIALDCAR